MKKLPIEEKAKRYDEAIERARAIFYQGSYKPNTAATIAETLQSVFPELKESEDYRIRKWLIAQLKIKSCNDNSRELEDMINKSIAWLEKQGEIDKASYEIAEKEKQEFVGDGFIKCYADFQDFKEGETYWLEYLGNDNYNVRSDNLLGKTYHITPCQLYTIFKKQTYLEKQDEHKPADKVELNFKVGDKIRKKSPSSFDKDMEVARIEKDYYVCNHIGKFSSEVVPFSEESYYELIEHNPTWSEEDEKMVKDIIAAIDTLYYHGMVNWLKSLKDRVQPQPKQEWSKEDEKIIKRIDSLLYSKCKIHESEYEEIHNWLKSLKPQNTWKPSDEQLEVLREALAHIPDEYDVPSLTEIYEQLKKLKGE